MTTENQTRTGTTPGGKEHPASSALESSTSSFPIGNDQDADNSLRPKSTPIKPSNRSLRTKNGFLWEGGRSVVFATPHPYRDVPRLRQSYDVVPRWLYQTEVLLDKEASAVTLTYPDDVEAVTTLLLPVIGFPGPYLVLPVRGICVSGECHEEVMVIARRPVPPPSVDQFRLAKGVIKSPADVAETLQPGATQALRIFMPDDCFLYDSPPHPRACFGPPPPWSLLGGSFSTSPSCWKAWDE